MTEARKGKIARLPLRLRDAVCEGLRDGDTAADICAWLNKRADVQAMLAKNFKGEPISEQNISTWRAGGYEEWLADQSRVENIKRLSDFSVRIAQAAGTSLTAGACAIASGRVQNMIEGLADEDLAAVIPALKMLADADINRARLKNDRTKLEQSERDLRLREDKQQTDTCEKFLAWYSDKKAQTIAESNLTNAQKIAALRKAYFSDVDALEKAGSVHLPS
jgi:hypothetical protein